MDSIYIHTLEVPASAIDANGHVNNVAFVQWMQDAAIGHADAAGCTAATRDIGATWVVRSHRIEYSRPAFGGDLIQVRTWVANFRRAFSLRKYQFIRPADQVELATGETDWILVDIAAGRPKSIPPAIVAMFEIVPTPETGKS
jgi:acyl-CoA thioester hydrolase